MSEHRRLAAIISADVAGYSRLMGKDESGTLAALKALRQEVVDPAIASHGGRIVKTTGDGLLLEFASVVDAVRCVIEVQTAMATKTADVQEDHRIAFRIGINLGDIIVDGDDIFGDGVNVAARLQEIAAPGGICISSRVHEDVRDRLDTAFDDAGTQTLKNIARPVQVWRWAPNGTVQAKPEPTSIDLPLPDKASIAVLPFQNMSGDPEQEYFADGMVEEITTLLSRQRWLFVIARTSAFTYKGRILDAKQVGRELGVRYLLEGSVRKAGNRVRVTAQLIDALSGAHLWADNFDGTLEDIFELHDRVAMEVAGAVEPSVRNAEIDRSLRKPTQNLDAYDLYLRASTVFRDPSPHNLQTALALTERALALDPHFARVLALRAACILHSVEAYGPHAATEALRLAHAALATSSDDSEATSFAAMTIALMGGSIETALLASQHALDLNPGGFFALLNGGWVECAANRPDIAVKRLSRAMRLSPRDPLRGYAELGLAIAHRDLGQAAEALAWARRAMLTLPRLAGGYRAAAAALVDLDRVDEAQEVIRQLRAVLPQARIDAAFIRRQNRDHATVESWITALRRAGLPD